MSVPIFLQLWGERDKLEKENSEVCIQFYWLRKGIFFSSAQMLRVGFLQYLSLKHAHNTIHFMCDFPLTSVKHL